MKYLVIGSNGPGFSTTEEAVQFINNRVQPTFNLLKQWENEKKILAGGVPIGARTLIMIMEAASHNELDELLRSLTLWGSLTWKITPLTCFSSRAISDYKEI